MSNLNQIVVNQDAVAVISFLFMLVLSYLLSELRLSASPALKPVHARVEPRLYQWYEAADGGTSAAAQDMLRDYRRRSVGYAR